MSERNIKKASMVRSVKSALSDLTDSTDKMLKRKYPPVSPPRPRVFVLSHDPLITWPSVGIGIGDKPGEKKLYVSWHEIACGSHRMMIIDYDPERKIVEILKRNEKKVKKFVHQVRAAARWCDRRRAGMERHSKNIEKQKKRIMESLKVEALMAALTTEEKK